MSTEPEGSTPNSLGLDLQSLKISDEKPSVPAPAQQPPHSETSSTEVLNDGSTVVAPPDAAESPAAAASRCSGTVARRNWPLYASGSGQSNIAYYSRLHIKLQSFAHGEPICACLLYRRISAREAAPEDVPCERTQRRE